MSTNIEIKKKINKGIYFFSVNLEWMIFIIAFTSNNQLSNNIMSIINIKIKNHNVHYIITNEKLLKIVKVCIHVLQVYSKTIFITSKRRTDTDTETFIIFNTSNPARHTYICTHQYRSSTVKIFVILLLLFLLQDYHYQFLQHYTDDFRVCVVLKSQNSHWL